MSEWRMKGEYLKNCNCAPTCSCDTTGDPLPHAYCEGLLGMRILEGRCDGIDLSGLNWVGVVHFPGAMHQGNGDWELYIDERASGPQRDALRQILTGKAGGTLFEIIAAVAPRHVGTHFVPIDWRFDKRQRQARLSIPGFIETVTEPLRIIPTGEEQRVIVRLPNGFEYKEMEVARATILRSSSRIRFEWQGTHSSLAHVEHTHAGLIA